MAKWSVCAVVAFGAALAVAAPAAAQVSLEGVWSPRYHEDQLDRVPGPELGDYTGLPITDGARLAADSWDASRLTLTVRRSQACSSISHRASKASC